MAECCFFALLTVLFTNAACLVLTNLALDKQAYQTDTLVWYGNPDYPSRAVDGSLTSCSHTNTADTTWEVDLGQQAFIDHVTIYNRQSNSYRLQEVEVYIGEDRESYRLAAYKPGQAGMILTFNMTVVRLGRWVMVTRAIPWEQLVLAEVQVFGYPLKVKFRQIRGAQGNGGLLSTTATLSASACSYLCLNTLGCAGATYNSNSRSCSMFDSSESVPSSNENVFLAPFT